MRYMKDQEEGDLPTNEKDACSELYRHGRELLVALKMSEEGIQKILYWEQPKKQAADLYSEGVIVFTEVLDNAREYFDDEELLAQEMPGVRIGGIAAFNDPRLGSVYGQILLYLLLQVRPTELVGGLIAQASLETDYPHLPQAASKAIQGWPEELLTPTLKDAWQAYKRRLN